MTDNTDYKKACTALVHYNLENSEGSLEEKAQKLVDHLERPIDFNGLGSSRSFSTPDDYAKVIVDGLAERVEPVQPETEEIVQYSNKKSTEVSNLELTLALSKDAGKAIGKGAIEAAKFVPYTVLGLLPAKAQDYIAEKVFKDGNEALKMTRYSSFAEGTSGVGLVVYSGISLYNKEQIIGVLSGLVIAFFGYFRGGFSISDTEVYGHPITSSAYHLLKLIPRGFKAAGKAIKNKVKNKKRELTEIKKVKALPPKRTGDSTD